MKETSPIIKYLGEEYKYIVNLNPGVDCIVYGKREKRIYLYHPNTDNEIIYERFPEETFPITYPYSDR